MHLRTRIGVCSATCWLVIASLKGAEAVGVAVADSAPKASTEVVTTTKVSTPPTTRGPLSVTDQKSRERAQAERQRLLERAEAQR